MRVKHEWPFGQIQGSDTEEEELELDVEEVNMEDIGEAQEERVLQKMHRLGLRNLSEDAFWFIC